MVEIIKDAKYVLTLTAGKSAEDVLGGLLFFSILLIAIGLTSIIYPRLFWHLRIGRRVKGLEPSSLYLWVLRFGGILVLALGILMITYTL